MLASELFKIGGVESCSGCGQPIQEKYLYRVSDACFYHERCLCCAACGDPLDRICYSRQSNLYCRHDYNRLYSKKCLGCGDAPGPNELVMRAGDSVYHVRCFVCVVCGIRLQRGDHCVLKQGQLFCRHDYEKEVEMMQGYLPGDYSCEELLSPRCGDGRRGPKRPRTILTTQQRRAFKASFEISPKPCRKIREGLAKDTGLSVRIVQVWFQNQRAKMKKIQKKARDGSKTGGVVKEPLDHSGDEDEHKGGAQIKQEDRSPQRMASFLNDSCSEDAENTDQDNRGYFSIKQEIHSIDEVYYKDSLAGHEDFAGAEDKSEEGLLQFQCVSHGGQQGPHLQLIGPHALVNNPIDRLYSMQTSYFCSEDSPTIHR